MATAVRTENNVPCAVAIQIDDGHMDAAPMTANTAEPDGCTIFIAQFHHAFKFHAACDGGNADRRVAVPYSTVMRYKKTAQRLRQLLSLDDRIPLEWVMDGIPADRSLPTALAAPFSAARHRLAAILRENRSLASLVRTVEAKLGIVRLVTVRRGKGRRRAGAENRREHTCFSGISHEWSAHATEERTEATKAAILRVLAEENPDGRVLHLQHRLRHWLSTLERRRPPER